MGTDIFMHIVKDKKYIKKEIFDGRCGEWFNNLQNNGFVKEYDYLMIDCGVSDQAPDDVNEERLKNIGYYEFHNIKVEDFKNWFREYSPDKDAGWVTKRTAWMYETKNIPISEESVSYSLDKDDILEDMVFVVFDRMDDYSGWLFQYLIENNIPDDAYIIYWFG